MQAIRAVGSYTFPMQDIKEFRNVHVDVLFTDIDDTLTDHGQLGPHAYSALWKLHDAGVKVVPITGRPAGWCEMIARFWPVDGIVGENGGFFFRYDQRHMKRHFIFDEKIREENRHKLELIRRDVLREVSGAAVASDQFSRLMDLAIDFSEDVAPLAEAEVDKIVAIFERHGAQAKVSSIHVNGWFGTYDKLSMCREFAKRELNIDVDRENARCAFSGDSPNDEPMFGFFQNAFAVANIRKFLPRLKAKPAYVTTGDGGHGFVEIADAIIRSRRP